MFIHFLDCTRYTSVYLNCNVCSVQYEKKKVFTVHIIEEIHLQGKEEQYKKF